MAELCAIHFGLQMVWRKNYRMVTIESDSLEAVNLVLGFSEGNSENQSIIQRCKELLARTWTVEVKHILREANRVSDWLVNWALKLNPCVVEMTCPPNQQSRILEEDASEMVIPRSEASTNV